MFESTGMAECVRGHRHPAYRRAACQDVPMRFAVTQTYPISRDEVLEMYTGTEMWGELSGFTKVSVPEVVGRTKKGDLVTVRLRYRFIAPLPTAATAVVNRDKLVWIEETVTDLSAGTATVDFQPENYASKLAASAAIRYEQLDDAASRTVQGDLRVKVLFVGGQVEKAITSGLSDHLAQEERAVLDTLKPAG